MFEKALFPRPICLLIWCFRCILIAMLPVERKIKIADIIEARGFASVQELSSLISASPMTIRRDLTELEKQSGIKRVRGGAVSIKRSNENPFKTRFALDSEEKGRIGRKAASLIEAGDVVYLGSGTTVAHMAPVIAGMVGITVVTSSFQVIQDLAHQRELVLVFLGGIVREDNYSTVGPSVETQLMQHHFHKTFIGASGVLPNNGVFNSDVLVASLEKIAVQRSEKVFVLADHTKFGRGELIHVVSCDELAGLITDTAQLSSDLIQQLETSRVPVITAAIDA